MTRQGALDWAAAARAARHDVRSTMSSGQRSLADVLDAAQRDPMIGHVKLLWALESLPGARKVDTRRTLASMGLAEAARLSTLDAATVQRVVSTFRPIGPGR